MGNRRDDLNGVLKGLKLEEVMKKSSHCLKEEFVVKEMEYRNGQDSKWKNIVEEKIGVSETIGMRDKNYKSLNNSDEAVLELYSRNFNSTNGLGDLYPNDSNVTMNDVKEYEVSSQSKTDTNRVKGKVRVEKDYFVDRKASLIGAGSSNTVSGLTKPQSIDKVIESKENNCQLQITGEVSVGDFMDNPWPRSEELKYSSSELWKDCSVNTLLPFPKGDASTSYDMKYGVGDKEGGMRKPDNFATTQGNIELKSFGDLGFPVISMKQKEELPRLPPVKLKSEDKPSSITWEEKHQRDGPGSKTLNADSSYHIGSFLHVPIGQEISSSGGKRHAGGNWFSVSQGITEDTSDPVSGLAIIGDGLSESLDYPNDYWDSDEYDDDDDVGYMRQPIEDETWFLAHQVDYPSDNEKKTGHENSRDLQGSAPEKNEDDDQSFAEEDSYLSGDQYFHSKNVDPVSHSEDMIGQYDGQLMYEEELSLMRAEPVWKGFVTQTDELIMLSEGQVLDKTGRLHLDDVCVDEDQHGSVRSIGVGINSDVADFGSEFRDSLVGGSSEGELEYIRDNDVGILSHDSEKKYVDQGMKDKRRKATTTGILTKNASENGFSFPPPRDGQQLSGPNKPYNAIVSEETDDRLHTLMDSDDLFPSWRRKSSSSSPVKSSRDEDDDEAVGSANSIPSSLSNYGYAERACQEDQKLGGLREEEPEASLEDEEAAAVLEQVNHIKAQEEEYETFELKIVHRKNRTGFEEDKNFNVVLNSVIAGRYYVTEYLGSAAFSKAIQAHDLHTGMDVCVKIIKNNKDFFDQSLDEIKLLKYINKHDPGDKYHLLRLYDYFYYREHLLIVCELLKANLYEFHMFNRESGGEVYFTMSRLQSRSYRAPEVILGLPYNKKIDIWSLGCILAELCTGNVLFQNDSQATLLARVTGIISPIGQDMLAKGRDTYKYFSKNHMLYERNQDTNRLEYLIPKRTSLRHRLPMGDQGFIDFVSYLLKVDPKKRPSAAEALKHPWLSYPYEPISS